MSAGLKNYALILENFLWEALWINRPFGKWGTKRSIVEKITEGQERPKHHPAERGLFPSLILRRVVPSEQLTIVLLNFQK